MIFYIKLINILVYSCEEVLKCTAKRKIVYKLAVIYIVLTIDISNYMRTLNIYQYDIRKLVII